MIVFIIKKIIGSKNDREVKRLRPMIFLIMNPIIVAFSKCARNATGCAGMRQKEFPTHRRREAEGMSPLALLTDDCTTFFVRVTNFTSPFSP